MQLPPEGLPCALVSLTPFARDVLPVHSVLFRDWLADTFHREHKLIPSLLQVRTTLQLFEAKARRNELSRALRISHRGEPFDPAAILIDLCNSDGDAIEISAEGWHVIPTACPAFAAPAHNNRCLRPRSRLPHCPPNCAFHRSRSLGSFPLFAP